MKRNEKKNEKGETSGDSGGEKRELFPAGPAWPRPRRRGTCGSSRSGASPPPGCFLWTSLSADLLYFGFASLFGGGTAARLFTAASRGGGGDSTPPSLSFFPSPPPPAPPNPFVLYRCVKRKEKKSYLCVHLFVLQVE